MMASLLKEWSEGTEVDVDAEINEDVEVPDDDQINEMMAIHESDLEIYRAMDLKREEDRLAAWIVKQNSLGRFGSSIDTLPSRLMTVDEVPRWITESSWNTKTMHGVVNRTTTETFVEDLSIGRKRKDVVYDDGLTDDQYCRGLEHLADDLEMKRKKAREEEIAARIEKKAITQQTTAPRAVKTILSETVNKTLEKLMTDLQRLKKDDGTPPSFYFKTKPDRALYPDYYQVIVVYLFLSFSLISSLPSR